uniref:Uncharacterized protein n=1 Tax=viral metagenome TaxID=1070528 RepID=A0A6C0H8N7_9ZZZZ
MKIINGVFIITLLKIINKVPINKLGFIYVYYYNLSLMFSYLIINV